MEDIQRYDFYRDSMSNCYCDMESDMEGSYVLYTDHKAALQAERKRAEKAEAEASSLASAAEKFHQERWDLTQANAALKAELERIKSVTWCAYCGYEVQLNDDALPKIIDHIMTCLKHPIRPYIRHCEALEEQIAALKGKYHSICQKKEFLQEDVMLLKHRLAPIEAVYKRFEHMDNLLSGYSDCYEAMPPERRFLYDLWHAIKESMEEAEHGK